MTPEQSEAFCRLARTHLVPLAAAPYTLPDFLSAAGVSDETLLSIAAKLADIESTNLQPLRDEILSAEARINLFKEE